MFLSLLLNLFLLPQPALAQASAKIQGLLIEADNLSRDSDLDLVELEGHVQIVKDDQHISCDQARIFLRTKRVELLGRVKMISPKNTVGGDFITLDYESNTGMIYNGFVQSGSVIFEGKTLQKLGDDEYFVTNANYTTCTNCPAAWSFAGQKIRAELGAYAYIKNSILKFGSVPVLWLPYLIVPLKSDRQSGLLPPEFEQSSGGGFAVTESFFWAINRSEDATVAIKNYEKRGTKGLLNYRYMFTENSFGEFDTAMIRDNAFKDNGQLRTFRPAGSAEDPINRWFLKYSHYYDLPGGYVNRLFLNNASDLLYPNDFPLETGNYGDSAMENRLSITKNTNADHWHIEGDYYINLLRSNPLGGNDDAVHRLPELSYSKTQTLIGNSNFAYSWNLNYVNFARVAKGYDDLSLVSKPLNGVSYPNQRYINNGAQRLDCEDDPLCKLASDGSFQSYNDLIRTGQRLDFEPALYYPIQLVDGVELFPKFSFRETHYNFDAGDDRTNVRRYARTELSARATLSKVYGNLSDPLSNRILHEIQPELKYTRIPWIEQHSSPFFGFSESNDSPFSTRDAIGDGDLISNKGLQFDYNDRIYDSNLLTFGIVNRWVEKSWNLNTPQYRQIALLKVSQSYDAYQDSKRDDSKVSWSDIAVVANVSLNHFETYTNLNYYPKQKVTNTSARMRLTNDSNQFIQLGLTKNYNIVTGQAVVNTSQRTEDYTIASGFQSAYINLMGKIVYNGKWAESKDDNQIKSWAYIAQVKPPGECWLITFIHDQSSIGETNFRLNFEFNFDGVPKPSLPPEALDKFGF